MNNGNLFEGLPEARISYIECRGNRQQTGEQYGEAARSEIADEIAAVVKIHGEKLQEFAGKAENALRRFAPEILEELAGIAAGANAGLAELLYLNTVDTFDKVDRCTPVTVRNSDRGQLIAKNNDGFPPELTACPFVVRKVTPDKGMPFIQVTYAGWLSGLDMLNAVGLSNTHGSVGSIFERSGERLDIRLRVYQLMRECTTVDEVLTKLPDVPLTGKGFAIAFGDVYGDNAMVDAAVPYTPVRSRRKDFEFATNLYMAPGYENADTRTPEGKIINRKRYEYLSRAAAPQTLEQLQALLAAHGDGAPCRHGTGKLSRTMWSMISILQERKMLFCDRHPCRGHWQEFSL